MIYEAVDFDYDEIPEEIEDYLEEYHRRFRLTLPYVDENNYIQLSFYDLYPGLFTDNEWGGQAMPMIFISEEKGEPLL